MSWGKLRKNVKEFLCPALAKRLDFHITSYHRDNSDADRRYLGRGWITLDGEEILSFSGKAVHWAGATPNAADETTADRQYLYEAIKLYPQLSLDHAFNSTSYIIQALALVDRRMGKNRLTKFDISDRHPFVVRMYELRCEVDGIKRG